MGNFSLQQIQLSGNLLVLKGRRIYRVFDSYFKPLDLLIDLQNNHPTDHKKLAEFLQKLTAEIEIELPSETPNQEEILSAVKGVFLEPGEPMAEIVPEVWRTFFEHLEHQPHRPNPMDTVSHVVTGNGISPSHPVYTPDPEYSEPARKLMYEGTVVLSLIVDTSGRTKNIQITTPLGLGLDEKAVEALSTWKFEPAQKMGDPWTWELL